MSEHETNVDAFRQAWIDTQNDSEGYALLNMDPPTKAEAGGEFDEFIRQVKAEAWEEGHNSGFCDGQVNYLNAFALETPNPYRTAPELKDN